MNFASTALALQQSSEANVDKLCGGALPQVVFYLDHIVKVPTSIYTTPPTFLHVSLSGQGSGSFVNMDTRIVGLCTVYRTHVLQCISFMYIILFTLECHVLQSISCHVQNSHKGTHWRNSQGNLWARKVSCGILMLPAVQNFGVQYPMARWSTGLVVF